MIAISVAEYESVRRDPTRFAVVPGHEIADIEDVVECAERYAVVRKRPETWEIAERTDPRRHGRR